MGWRRFVQAEDRETLWNSLTGTFQSESKQHQHGYGFFTLINSNSEFHHLNNNEAQTFSLRR